jgi:phosphoserine phosphatase
MDGTLLRRTSAPVLLAAALGRDESLVELEERLATGATTAVEFARALHDMWGVVPTDVARRAFAPRSCSPTSERFSRTSMTAASGPA